jgi:type II secretory ATPase GspE/PulE/Tfp pilus assembly ATPase PilB-like protein
MGRTSIFELLVIEDTIRDALIKQPKLEILRKVARKAGHRTLQEEGIVLVAQGITSVAELTRVLKQ